MQEEYKMKLQKELKKRVVVVGAASGIGKSVAMRFAEEGWDVCISDIQEFELSKVYKHMPSGSHILKSGDCSDEVFIDQLSGFILKEWGDYDVLVNCVGISERTDLMKMSISEWRKSFDIMVNGSLFLTKMSVNHMSQGGRIIHISSIHGSRAEHYSSSYSMAKASINQMCRSMALELADQNILVNAIAPGFVDTPMSIIDGINETKTEWFHDNYVKGNHLPLRRAAMPDEIAGVAWFLAGKDSTYITGQVIVVDGGLSITF